MRVCACVREHGAHMLHAVVGWLGGWLVGWFTHPDLIIFGSMDLTGFLPLYFSSHSSLNGASIKRAVQLETLVGKTSASTIQAQHQGPVSASKEVLAVMAGCGRKTSPCTTQDRIRTKHKNPQSFKSFKSLDLHESLLSFLVLDGEQLVFKLDTVRDHGTCTVSIV